jgi:hypothetical protein
LGTVKKIFATACICAVLLVAFLALSRRGTRTGASPDDPAPVAAASAPPKAIPVAVVPTAPAPVAAIAMQGAAPGVTDELACGNLAELCSTSDQKVDSAECQKKLADSRKLSGSGNVDRATVCIAEARTCAAATGCLSGSIGVGALGEFFKGLGSALSNHSSH